MNKLFLIVLLFISSNIFSQVTKPVGSVMKPRGNSVFINLTDNTAWLYLGGSSWVPLASNPVHLTGDESITGIKTFSGPISNPLIGYLRFGGNGDFVYNGGSDKSFHFTSKSGHAGNTSFVWSDSLDVSYFSPIVFYNPKKNNVLVVDSLGLMKVGYGLDVGKKAVFDTVSIRGGTSSQYMMADGSRTTGGVSTSGSYTPSFSNTTNISVSSLGVAYYSRIGNIVHVMVSGAVTSTTTGGSVLTISLPFSSSVGSSLIIGQGVVSSPAYLFVNGNVQYNYIDSSHVTFTFNSVSTSISGFVIQFDYSI